MVVKKLILLLCSSLAAIDVASATYAKNLNYRSRSENHPSLGISVRKVVKRSDPTVTYTPSQLNFTHGVASGGQSGHRSHAIVCTYSN
jgi:alkaline phosphatase D